MPNKLHIRGAHHGDFRSVAADKNSGKKGVVKYGCFKFFSQNSYGIFSVT